MRGDRGGLRALAGGAGGGGLSAVLHEGGLEAALGARPSSFGSPALALVPAFCITNNRTHVYHLDRGLTTLTVQ